MGKRWFDVIVSTAALLLLWPLFAVIALAIRLDSPGPVFFRQERVGRFGVPFRIHKFRTMVDDPALQGRQITVGDDPRITRVGAVLRRTKLDELAQLIDVLQGTMSLVGPRPEVPRYVQQCPAPVRDKVLSVRPGITDLASIEYRRESELRACSADPERTYVQEVLPRKLHYAQQYVEHATLWTDVRLLARTLQVLLSR